MESWCTINMRVEVILHDEGLAGSRYAGRTISMKKGEALVEFEVRAPPPCLHETQPSMHKCSAPPKRCCRHSTRKILKLYCASGTSWRTCNRSHQGHPTAFTRYTCCRFAPQMLDAMLDAMLLLRAHVPCVCSVFVPCACALATYSWRRSRSSPRRRLVAHDLCGHTPRRRVH